MIITICSGGNLGDWALPYIHQADYIIGVDQGAHFLIQHGIAPDISMGDFDSVTEEQFAAIQATSKSFVDYDAIDKNYTDTHLAVIHALEQQPTAILLIGALGTRFDHSLSNIHVLEHALEQGVSLRIIDKHNVIQLMNSKNPLRIERLHYRYVSLLPYSDQVTNIQLEGFKYPLNSTPFDLTRGLSLGISNELVAEQGVISIGSGKLLVIQAND